MEFLLPLLIGLLVGAVLGALLGLLLARRRPVVGDDPAIIEARHQTTIAEIRGEEAQHRAQLSTELAALQATSAGLREQVASAHDQYRELIERMRVEQAAQTERERAESKVLQQLAPVQETLRSMQAKVTELETQRSLQHGELTQQLKSATEAEERLRATAETLASALSNNVTRGVWGETQLRTLVESAGLINRVDFFLQESVTAESGDRRPDMVLRLPGGKSIAVDAKVPYNAYIEANSIPSTATSDEQARRAALLADHAKKVKAHVDALATKTYWTGLDASPEFTIAFIPNEPLLAAALEKDPTLLEYAFSKRIALASPVSFWAVLKTVAFTWQQDVLTEDAKDLFDLGKELYGRLATLADHADKLRSAIDRTVSTYNTFASSLETRVLVTARKLDALDESRVIGTPALIDSRPRQLTAAELLEVGTVDKDSVDNDSVGTVSVGDANPRDER